MYKHCIEKEPVESEVDKTVNEYVILEESNLVENEEASDEIALDKNEESDYLADKGEAMTMTVIVDVHDDSVEYDSNGCKDVEVNIQKKN